MAWPEAVSPNSVVARKGGSIRLRAHTVCSVYTLLVFIPAALTKLCFRSDDAYCLFIGSGGYRPPHDS